MGDNRTEQVDLTGRSRKMCLRKQLLSLLEGREKVFPVKGRARVRTLGQEGGSVAQSRTKGRLVWLAEGEGTL